MTADAILVLPAEQLPRALYDAGVAPGSAFLDSEQNEICVLGVYTYWHPERNWEQCMPLVERFRMTLTYTVYHKRVPSSELLWIVAAHHGLDGWGTSQRCTFAEVPAMVCRLALLAAYHAPRPERRGFSEGLMTLYDVLTARIHEIEDQIRLVMATKTYDYLQGQLAGLHFARGFVRDFQDDQPAAPPDAAGEQP